MDNWKFLSYISDTGTNYFKDWLDSLPLRARLAINTRLQYLETVDKFERPYTGKLVGFDGLFEIRILCDKVQYRPIACYGTDRKTVVLLAGAIEKDSKLLPKDVCKRALKYKKDINKPGRTNEHSY